MDWLRRLFRRILDKHEWIDRRSYERIRFAGGTLRVAEGDCGMVDIVTMRQWADKAYIDMLAYHPRLPQIDLRVRGEDLDSRNGYVKLRDGVVVYRCGVETVIRHELFHYWAWKIGLPYYMTINHPDGHSLDGTPK